MGKTLKIYIRGDKGIGSFSLYGLGDKKDDKFVFNKYEILYLFEKGAMVIKDDRILRNFADIVKELNIDILNYFVFKDLIERGYKIKIKNNIMIVLDKYSKEPLWVLFVKSEIENITDKEILKMVDIAKENKVLVLLAVVDSEMDITYYSIKEIRL